MYPSDCPKGWKYEDHPDRAILTQRTQALLALIRSQKNDTLRTASDSRSQHGFLFNGLTPPGCDYFAGHYRGENFHCLRFYPVVVPADPRVGAHPSAVEYLMSELRAQLRSGLLALDANVALSPKQRLQYIVVLACSVFVNFLTIHPYANGNGHAGRLIVWCITGRYGFWPKNWPIEPRPPDPPYSDMIRVYRDGNREPLEMLILQTLVN